MSNFEQQVLATALDKLFKARSFSICTLNDIGELVGVSPDQHPNYKHLHALHCVKYSDMSPIILKELQAKVMETLQPQWHSGAILAKAILIEGNDHINTEDTRLLS